MKVTLGLLAAWPSLFLGSAAIGHPKYYSESITATQMIGSHFGVPGLPATFDYVIVGGGTAGLTLARRLAADTRYTVAVIDAGDFYEFANGNNSQVPSYASVFTGSDPLTRNPYLDWYQFTTPQPVRRPPSTTRLPSGRSS